MQHLVVSRLWQAPLPRRDWRSVAAPAVVTVTQASPGSEAGMQTTSRQLLGKETTTCSHSRLLDIYSSRLDLFSKAMHPTMTQPEFSPTTSSDKTWEQLLMSLARTKSSSLRSLGALRS